MLIDTKAKRERTARICCDSAGSRRSYCRYSRFLQPDPIGYEAGMNLYGYVRNDPVNLVDPLGLREICWRQSNGDGYKITYRRPDGSDGVIVVSPSFSTQCMNFSDFAFTDPSGPRINWGGGVSGPTQSVSPDQKRACPVVPAAPSGVDINKIVSYGRALSGMNLLNKYAFTYNNFRSKAGMDFKQIRSDPNRRSPFEDFGNFAYGAFTQAIGLGSVSHAFAGIAQILSGNAEAKNVTTNFDDPADQRQITAGARYAACMGSS